MRVATSLVLTLLTAVASAAGELPLPHLQIGRATSAIKVDGRLGERAWADAARIPVLQNWKTGDVVSPRTEVRACWDEKNFYVAYVCFEPHMSQIVARTASDVWMDDDVELFVQPPGKFAYYHFMINPLGRLQTEKIKDVRYVPHPAVAARREKDRWVVELAIAWKDIGGPPAGATPWRVNFHRVRKPRPSYFAGWSVTNGPFHQPRRFGIATFVQKLPCVVTQLDPGPRRLGFNRVSIAGVARDAAGAVLSVSLGDVALARTKLPANGAWRCERGGSLNLEAKYLAFQITKDKGESPVYSQAFPLNIRGSGLLAALEEAAKDAARLARRTDLPRNVRAFFQARVRLAAKLIQRSQAEIRNAAAQRRSVDEKAWKTILDEAKRIREQVNRPLAWTRNPFLETKPRTMPSELKDEIELQVETFVNERETAALLLFNPHAQKVLNLRVTLGALRLAPTATNDSADRTLETARVSLAEAVMIRSAVRGMIADPIVPLDAAGRFLVPPGETRELWLTVDTFDARPGLYQGMLRLQPLDPRTNAWTLHVPVSVRIWPVKLAKTSKLKVFNFDYARGARSDAHLRNLLEHRVNVFALYVPTPDRKGHADFSILDDEIARVKSHGQIFFECWFFRSEGWKPQHERWVKDLVAYMKSKGLGYDDWMLHIFDETLNDLFLDTAKHIKQVDPNLRLFSDRMGPPERLKQFAPYIDYWCPHYRDLPKPGLRTMRASGHPIWTYDCGSGKAVPPSHNRALPWCAWFYKLDGVCYWTYFSSFGDTWNDFDHGHPDWSKVYPGATGEPLSSKRWDAWREGLEDLALLDLYQSALKTQGGPAAEDKKLLAQIASLAAKANGPADQLEALSNAVMHRILKLRGVEEVAFPPFCDIAWRVRRAGDGKGRVLRIPAAAGGKRRQTGACLRSATKRSWTFLLRNVEASNGDKVVLRLRARGNGRLKVGVCEGFRWGASGAGHRTSIRIVPLKKDWTTIEIKHLVKEQPVGALIGFDYGNEKTEAIVRDYEVKVIRGE